jgi:hypothetical protein
LFLIKGFCPSNLIHHPICFFGAASPPGQVGQGHICAKSVSGQIQDGSMHNPFCFQDRDVPF